MVTGAEAERRLRRCRSLTALASHRGTFLEEQAPGKATTTVRQRLYAIRKVHRLLRLQDPTWDEEINLTFRRVRRAKLSRPKQAKGITRAYLDQFVAAQPDTPWGLRNTAMMSLGYDLLTRRSELVALATDDIELRADGTLRAIIWRSKVDPSGLGRGAFTSRRTADNIRAWLKWRGMDIHFLFCPIYRPAPGRPSVITGVLGFDSRRFLVWQARRARCHQVAQALGALLRGSCCRAMNAA